MTYHRWDPDTKCLTGYVDQELLSICIEQNHLRQQLADPLVQLTEKARYQAHFASLDVVEETILDRLYYPLKRQ
jgi:hypothetical protein